MGEGMGEKSGKLDGELWRDEIGETFGIYLAKSGVRRLSVTLSVCYLRRSSALGRGA